MLIPRPALAAAASVLGEAPGGLRVASVEVDPALDPLDLVRAGAAAFGSAAYFAAPGGAALGGLGTAWEARAAGPGRLEDLDAALAGLPCGAGAFLGFSFDADGPASPEWAGFPAAAARLAQIALWRREGAARLILAVPPGASPAPLLAAAATLRPPGEPEVPVLVSTRAVPPLADWRQAVAAAAGEASAGGPAKVVLARSLRVSLGAAPEPFDLVERLRRRFPGCYAYGWQAGAAALVGASPELLVSRSGERFTCRPLAGSAARGESPEADRLAAEALLASSKDRAEHAFVVAAVAEALGPLARTLEIPDAPVVDRLEGVQHLATPITGTTSARLLRLAAALHPTPAVGGVPREEALASIRAAEGFDRGWYAGGVGWADGDGDGEVTVALRGALVQEAAAILYAGAGVVAGSDPSAEAAETDLKLGAVLGVFGSA